MVLWTILINYKLYTPDDVYQFTSVRFLDYQMCVTVKMFDIASFYIIPVWLKNM